MIIATKLVTYTVIEDVTQIQLKELFCFDFETASHNKKIPAYLWAKEEVEVLMLSITTDYENTYIRPIWDGYGFKPLTQAEVDYLVDVLEDDAITKVGHNIKFDMHVMRKMLGVDYHVNYETFYDTMVMGHRIDCNYKKSLKDWAGIYWPEYEGYDDGIKYTFETPFNDMATYAAIDTLVASWLFDEFMEHLELVPIVLNMHYHYDQISLWSFYEAEKVGVTCAQKSIQAWIDKAQDYIDRKEAKMNKDPQIKRFIKTVRRHKGEQKIELIKSKLEKHKPESKQYAKYLAQIADIRAGKIDLYPKINFSSPSQMSELFYSDYGFGLHGEGTDEKQLKKIDHPFMEDLMDYRSISKLKSTYYHGIQDSLVGNRLHCSFNLVGTVTGRISSSDPNLQNIPKHIKRKDVELFTKAVRSFFIAPEDYYMVQFDYSQAELRMIANISKDPTMIRGYLDGVDIHAQTGAIFAGQDYDEFYAAYQAGDKEAERMRQIAKSANFGLVYGMGLESYVEYIWDQTGVSISLEEGQHQITNFFAKYDKLTEWHYRSKATARHRGYARTLFGHRLPLPDIKAHKRWMRGQAERAAINMPVQGTIGQLTVWAGALAKQAIDPTTKYVLNVHDSGNYYIHKDHLETDIPLIKGIMENLPVEEYFGVSLGPVPMVVDVEYGKDWKNLKTYEI